MQGSSDIGPNRSTATDNCEGILHIFIALIEIEQVFLLCFLPWPQIHNSRGDMMPERESAASGGTTAGFHDARRPAEQRDFPRLIFDD